MKKYFIKVKGLYDDKAEGCPVTFRTVEEEYFGDNIKILNEMLDSGEIDSYEISLEPECTCFKCDSDCDILKPKKSHRSAVLNFYDRYFNGRYKI